VKAWLLIIRKQKVVQISLIIIKRNISGNSKSTPCFVYSDGLTEVKKSAARSSHPTTDSNIFLYRNKPRIIRDPCPAV